MRWVVTVLACGCVAAVVPGRARAEGGLVADAGPWCVYTSSTVDPPSGDVPANWPTFLVSLTGGARLGFDAARLVRVGDGVVVPTVMERELFPVSVGPIERLVPGEDYDLYHPVCPTETPRVTRYHATAPIEEPASLGTITVSPLLAANRTRGEGWREYFVDVTLAPDARFASVPWNRAAWLAESAEGSSDAVPISTLHARARVECFRTVGLRPGDHSFRGAGYVVRGDVRFFTPAVATTIAACADAMRVDYETLRPLTPDEIVFWDTVDMDAGVSRDAGGSTLDAGSLEAGSLDGGRMDVRTDPDTDTGCSVTHRHDSSVLWLAVLVASVFAVRQARRRRTRERE